MTKAEITTTSPLNEPIQFGIMSRVLPSKGNIAWEYNPFRNYRILEAKYYFRGKFFTKEELELELDPARTLKISEKEKDWNNFRATKNLPTGIHDYEDDPIFYDKNLLIDFDTDELKFDVNHPVDILPLYSYDGSVNLIINDGKNPPRLINSRFSPLGKNKYLIVDRKGDNDTNIYDLGSQFESDTSLYKTYVGIPTLDFINVYLNGNLSVGNYTFYFKYEDADGNETDFVAESRMVSLFKGASLANIHSGFRNENSFKSVRFLLSNIDPAYSYVKVYYTRSTSDINLNSTTSAYKINLKFLVNSSLVCSIYITGNEDTTEITVSELNNKYLIAGKVLTLEQCQNMLFFGNVSDYNIEYKEFADLSLRFLASPDTSKEYSPVPHDYNNVILNTYSDPLFIYNYTGYLNHEIYRLGIVYLMSNGSLSPVFNIRGMYFTKGIQKYSEFPVYEKNTRNYITYNEDTGIIYKSSEQISNEALENAFGVVRIESGEASEINSVIGIKITVDDKENTYKELAKYQIKGYFFVRLKRIPLRLCLALTIGADSNSNTPLLYTNKDTVVNSKSKDDSLKNFFISERFLSDSKLLTHSLEDRLYCTRTNLVNKYGAICPEYDINSPYLNTLFCGDEYVVELCTSSTPLQLDKEEFRHFYINNPTYIDSNNRDTTLTRIVGVEDNVKLVEVGNKLFSARAGEAEEAFRYEYITQELRTTDANNLLRGSFGPYLAFNGYRYPGTLVNIYIKDYLTMNKLELFKLRMQDKSSYYAISERYDITKVPENDFILYGGDSYICTFTHRVNRNFQDPSAPINHKIVDEKCWKDNYKVTDGVVKTENFEKINLGDVNAVKIGMWVTFSLVSSFNLNIRALDDSIPDETALTGHPRGFFPYYGMSADGAYKVPEALCYNKGFTKSVSERYNFEVPNVPAIKNDFTNRISYSDIHVNDAFKNGFRTFLGTHYRDYPKTYGQITKLVELRGNLICVFEHGVALIPVNERAVAGEGSGGNVFINTSNVLPENPKIISDTFGSQWKDSIIKTPTAIYGVDTIGKKIWRTNGENFECISDFRVLEFLNLNISLSEREITPVIGVRNVKTHYNKFKHDVMFTFYDNLYGFEEKVWNLCYNELQLKWITFYSWVPSYSENIYNQYFSFDRNTSKWITKLGISNSGNDFSDGVCLTNNIIPNEAKAGHKIGQLSLVNRTLPSGDGVSYGIKYELVEDNFQNYKNFEIRENSDNYYLYLKTNAVDLCSELFVRGTKSNNTYTEMITDLPNLKDDWVENCILSNLYCICKDDRGQRIPLDNDLKYNATNIVILLNIRANITVTYTGATPTLGEAYTGGYVNGSKVDAGYYQSVVAVIPEYNIQFLTTDFWKHGQAGIIDIADKIYPTYWYGKQHPFEFEFVVADNPLLHKIFDNLVIISNSAEPESFHYEIIGDCYDFAKDKKNMYIRLEATKELYLYNGCDVLYDTNYASLEGVLRPLKDIYGNIISGKYDKSTLLPLYYSRQDTFNDIEDYYHLKDNIKTKDFSALSGGEIVKYDTLNEYRIWNHAKAANLLDKGRLRGNMQYKEDRWDVLINPLNIVLKNESAWKNGLVPIELGQSPIPDLVIKLAEYNNNLLTIPDNSKDRDVVTWNWLDSQMRETKLKDKWIKIRIRYSGKKLAIITAIKTLYSISYS